MVGPTRAYHGNHGRTFSLVVTVGSGWLRKFTKLQYELWLMVNNCLAQVTKEQTDRELREGYNITSLVVDTASTLHDIVQWYLLLLR